MCRFWADGPELLTATADGIVPDQLTPAAWLHLMTSLRAMGKDERPVVLDANAVGDVARAAKAYKWHYAGNSLFYFPSRSCLRV